MNIAFISAKVASAVPDAHNIRTRETGGDIYSLACEMAGKTKLVQFNGAGLYPPDVTLMYAEWPKGDAYIADQIAKELRK